MNDWMILMLREKYNSEKEKEELWNKLCGHYGKKSNEIYMISKHINPGLSYYVFIKEQDKGGLWKMLSREKYFLEPFQYKEVSHAEVMDLTRGIECKRDTVRFGDIVKIKTGKYQKLLGIVLRETRNKNYDVGLKFCFGNVCEEMSENDLEVCGNLFKFIKINK